MTTANLTSEIVSLRKVLLGFTHRFTNDKEESHDLVQDTLLKALTYRDKFREQTNLKGWLFTIMRNTFINNYRKSQRARTSHDETKELYRLNIPDPHTFSSPDSRIEYEEIWKNVNQLELQFRIPFKMHTAGFKYHEIAEQLGIPVGTVKNRIFHARKEIQKKLSGY